MIISHPATQQAPAKPLKEHLRAVADNSRRQIMRMNLNLSLISSEEFAQLSYLIGLFHDFGKLSTFFQNYINQQDSRSALTHHSLISAFVCFHVLESLYPEHIWPMIGYLIIKRHHGNLETLDSESTPAVKNISLQLKDILENAADEINNIYMGTIPDISEKLSTISFDAYADIIDDIPDRLEDMVDELHPDAAIELFFIVNLLFSVLIDSDKKDAARLDNSYFHGNLEEMPNDIFAFLRNCQTSDEKNFSSEIPINALRNKFLNEIIENKNIKPENHFYTITAPTGIGKTFGCLAFANQLIQKLPDKKARIIYCLPYTAIIDQNHETFEKIIRFTHTKQYDLQPERFLLKHHYLTPKIIRNRKNAETPSYKDYLDDCLFVESWESAFIVTTFVQFFESVIGYRNRLLKKLHNIVNAVVILDEIQNIDPHYYYLLRETLDIFGKRLNTYFLLITATQPEILDTQKSGTIELVNRDFYMKHPLFNRVVLQFIKNGISIETFTQDFCQSPSFQNCLIVLNTKKSAIKMYHALKENIDGYNIFCLTTLLTPGDRKSKIFQIKQLIQQKEKIIVVSTQLIEAGVDLSFETVYRDFGPLDSIIQVAGRCNRSGEYGVKGGKMVVLKLYNEKKNYYYKQVYSSILLQFAEKVFLNDTYESKDFSDIAKEYYSQFDFKGKSGSLLHAIQELNYDTGMKDQTPVKGFKLIQSYNDETVYILTTPESQQYMERLLLLRKELRQKSEKEKQTDLLEIEKNKRLLKDFQISLRKDELKAYKDTFVLTEWDYIKFFSYEHQKAYVYDPDIGFMYDPKNEIEADGTSGHTAMF
jgi:CRISPR-associated endonuclease/helicase Cas3